MISYYLLVTIVDAFTAVTDDDHQIAEDIKDGRISQFLVKPIDYMIYRFFLFAAGRMIYLTAAAIPLGCFILYQREFFVLPGSALTFGCFLFSSARTACLQFFMSYTMA